jgi:hypothetical protein
MNDGVTGYRYWFGPALPFTGDPGEAEARVLRAIEKVIVFQPVPGRWFEEDDLDPPCCDVV